MGNNETRDELAELLRDPTPPIHAAASRALEKMYSEWGITPGLPTPAVAVHRMADFLAAEGWRPPSRVIQTAEGMGGFTDGAAAVAALDALPEGSVIRIGTAAYQRLSHWWNLPGSEDVTDSVTLVEDADGADIVVLWEPEAVQR